ncbi:hypothetical protein HMPREF0653_01633 [Prevotella disiens JCM 6334 = ATCC 29426]|uniref:Uncharacterized protein n=2 Tax=Prevotella disiens TaxID=28130 RepID=A0A379DVE5_9BACT|nr:hypothetical protein HMPREF0653_01633 [Prevotella disiens JCM 6334 = ATCC 29426]SUB84385.1 Uncharacterised protein [Prevotella disiens]
MHKIIIKQHHKDTLFLKFQLTYNFKSHTILSVLNIPYIRKTPLKHQKQNVNFLFVTKLNALYYPFSDKDNFKKNQKVGNLKQNLNDILT